MKIISQKYNGQLRSESTANYFEKSDEGLIVYSRPKEPFFYHTKGVWSQNVDGLIEIFLADCWYNVMHIFEQEKHDNAMYINLCMPPSFYEDRITWVDMDLDYRVGLDGQIELLDEKEFEENCLRWRYPDHLKQRIIKEAALLPEKIKAAVFPFNYNEQKIAYENWKGKH